MRLLRLGTALAVLTVSSPGTLLSAEYAAEVQQLREQIEQLDQELRRSDGAVTDQRVRNTAWQVAVSWFLTGEDNSFKPVVPKRPVTFHGDGWGAFEVAARIQQLKVDDDAFPLFANPATSAREAFSWGVGANWHLNRNVKLSLDFEHPDFKGGESSAFLREGENVILTRVQFQF
jgi:phosphate-selective porin OprO/OprP